MVSPAAGIALSPHRWWWAGLGSALLHWAAFQGLHSLGKAPKVEDHLPPDVSLKKSSAEPAPLQAGLRIKVLPAEVWQAPKPDPIAPAETPPPSQAPPLPPTPAKPADADSKRPPVLTEQAAPQVTDNPLGDQGRAVDGARETVGFLPGIRMHAPKDECEIRTQTEIKKCDPYQ
jgi:hypothetical protein